MAAAGVVGSLVAQIEDELDAVVAAIGDRIREEIPDFQRLPAETLATAVRGNVSRALAALRELRDPTADELERAAAVGRERAEQGLTVDAVLHAYRISITAVWSRFGELARAQGADVATVLAFSETLWRWADAVMDVVAAAHREVELEHAREEQQRRDAFVFALLTGTLDPDELRRESATFGLDPEREYVPFRARGASHRAALALGHDVHRARPRRRRDRAERPGRAAGRHGRLRGGGAARRASRPGSPTPAARCRPRWRSASRAPSRSPTCRSARRSSPTRRSATRSQSAILRRSPGSAWSSRTRCGRTSPRGCGSRRPRAPCTCTRTRCATACKRFEEATGHEPARPARRRRALVGARTPPPALTAF